MGHVDRHIDMMHAPTHTLTPRGVDPLDDFLDTVTAQTVKAVKTFHGSYLPVLGSQPSTGSQIANKIYTDRKSGSPHAHAGTTPGAGYTPVGSWGAARDPIFGMDSFIIANFASRSDSVGFRQGLGNIPEAASTGTRETRPLVARAGSGQSSSEWLYRYQTGTLQSPVNIRGSHRIQWTVELGTLGGGGSVSYAVQLGHAVARFQAPQAPFYNIPMHGTTGAIGFSVRGRTLFGIKANNQSRNAWALGSAAYGTMRLEVRWDSRKVQWFVGSKPSRAMRQLGSSGSTMAGTIPAFSGQRTGFWAQVRSRNLTWPATILFTDLKVHRIAFQRIID